MSYYTAGYAYYIDLEFNKVRGSKQRDAAAPPRKSCCRPTLDIQFLLTIPHCQPYFGAQAEGPMALVAVSMPVVQSVGTCEPAWQGAQVVVSQWELQE